MRFLLVAINAKYIHSNPAVYSLAAYAKQNVGEEIASCIDIVEYTINQRIDYVISDIYEKRPEIVAFSCYIWNIEFVMRITGELKKLLPDTEIWLGGPEVSYNAVSIINEHKEVTGIMLGEGEETFTELLLYYWRKHQNREFDTAELKIRSIKGIATRICKSLDSSEDKSDEENFNNDPDDKDRGDRVIVTDSRELTDISDLPFLYNDLDKFENRIIYYESSRGCPFNCSYCLSSIDKRVRVRDLDIVKRELQFFLDNKVKQVKFVDRTFNCVHGHAMAIWKYIKENDNKITNFHFEIAADILNEEELRIINSFRPGAVQMEIGVQSTNADTIKEIDRTMDVYTLRKIVAAIRGGNNVHIHLDLIAGLPYEDYASFIQSFNEVYDMKPDQLQLGFLKVLKGSKMHSKAGEYGIIYSDYPPYEVLCTKWISYEEILRLKRVEEMVEIYYNSNQFLTVLPLMISQFSNPFEFYERLSVYYKEQGLFVNTPSRIYRYNVLLDFAKKYMENKLDIIKEALVYDIYLREKAKSRPEFANDIIPKDKSAKFWKNEAISHEFLTEDVYLDMDSKSLERMSHIEAFNYDFSDGRRLDKTRYLLFNYKRRNPLNNQADVIEVNL